MRAHTLRTPAWPLVVGMLSICVAGCTVGPNYKRPPVTTPDSYRGQALAGEGGASLADEPWSSVFTDERLQDLIRTALARNYDLQIAAARILQAEAQLGITRSDQFPSVQADAGIARQRLAVTPGSDPVTLNLGQAQVSVAWELDFWGRYRRASESARAQLLATEWGRRAVAATLVSQVADNYYALRALDLQLEISKRTLASRQESLQLTNAREQSGMTSLVDVRQAEQLVHGASAAIAELEQRITRREDFISTLLGNNPGDVSRGRPLVDQAHAPELPAGLPSELLARRPDIQEAEQQLVAANAEIGVARSNYFPQISLTGAGGVVSAALSGLFSGAAGVWTAAASVSQPVFTAGRTRSQVALAEARYKEASLTYQQAIQEAFREVADAIAGYRGARAVREEQELLVQAAEGARTLADVRYRGGASSYLEVLDSETRLYVAELALADARLSELSAYVEFYRALGGGWQTQLPNQAPGSAPDPARPSSGGAK
jgi:outer membrane protein, multidrug efflux system